MEPERWRRIQDLFAAAGELPAADRAAYLDAHAGSDSDLRAEVERMLAADESAEDHLDGLIQAAADAIETKPHPRLPRFSGPIDATRIGPYRILREIGRGGMSTVYLAERDDEHYRQRVALKLVGRGPGSDEMRLHLRRERQILAGLDHPNIAKLLDGGSTDDDLPYFVMDHVEGEPVDAYCARRKLDVDERLRLFTEICSAVHYAHTNLVIHRDIKPSNILVTGAGAAKLLDFGIAKLIEPDSSGLTTDLATPTAPGLRLLTPAYASPEQLRGEPLTTATDVYSLGVLLYELLVGVRPFGSESMSRPDLERAILHDAPKSPSRRAARAPSEGAAGALITAEGSRARLIRRIDGDLDNIMLKALRKEPSRRYLSVEQLAGDVRNHLEGKPVIARPDTLSYRLGKFLRRNRRAVAAGLATLTLIVALVGFYTHRLAVERDRALQEERESAQVARFLVDLFGAADPEQALGERLTAREILQVGAARLQTELSGQPALRADLLEHVASIYLRLGLHEQAEPLLLRVEDLRRELHGPEHPRLAEVLHLRGRWLQATDELAAASQIHGQGLALRQRSLGEDHPSVADSLTDLAGAFYDAKDYERASELLRQALELRRQALEDQDPAIATSLNDLGAVLLEMKQPQEAEELLREALTRRLGHFGEMHPAVAESSGMLASILNRLGNSEEATRLFRQALAIRRQIYGSEHPLVGVSLNNLGHLLGQTGDPEAAEPLLREAVTLYRARPGAHRDALHTSLGNLAASLRLQDRPAEAAVVYGEALDIVREIEPDGRTVTILLWKLGDSHLAADDLDPAEDAYRKMLRLRRERYPDDHRLVASARLFLARVMLRRGRLAATEDLLESASAVLRRELPDHWLAAEAALLLGDCRRRQGRRLEARELLESALEILAGDSKASPEVKPRLEQQAQELLEALDEIQG